MAEAASPKRPPWFWPVVAVVIVVLAAGGFAAPSILECSSSDDGFGTCMNTKLAELGLATPPEEDAASPSTELAVAQPAAETEMPDPTVSAPDFGVRIEPDGSILIAGSGATGDTVEIWVNGELYGTAEVEPGGDWVLVPDAPLPPGGYEVTLVDPETNTPFDKSFVVAINEDGTSEPLVVASSPGEASEILQGLAGAGEEDEPTVVAEADTPAAESVADAQATDEPVEEEAAATEQDETATAVASSEQAEEAAAAINDQADMPADAEAIASTPPTVAEAETPAPAEEANATEQEDVVGDVAALERRIDALNALAPPSIEAVEIDNGRNFFAGTGADGAVIRLYVDNVFVGDTEVHDGRWLLETEDVLKNRSQRVRADQLLPGTADVASRAEIDFIFEEPAAEPSETVVAEAPVEVPEPDFGIDTDEPIPADAIAAEPDDETMVVAEAETPVAEAPVDTPDDVAEAPIDVPEPDFAIDTDTPIPSDAIENDGAVDAPEMVAEAPETEPAPAVETTELADDAGAGGSDDGVASAVAADDTGAAADSGTSGGTVSADSETSVATSGSGTAVEVPEPDFSVDTGLPVTVVPAEPETEVAETETPVIAPEEPEAVTPEPDETTEIAEAEEVPQLVAVPMGAPELGRFATGKAIIRAGDNLWTIARRVYGSGVRYTQIYGANRDQIRNPDLIYPGQVFALPEMAAETDTASN